MRVLTSQQMRDADRVTIERGTPGNELMRRAAQGVVSFLEREFAPLSAQRVIIFCGQGNNGGDGLVVAKLLEGRVAGLQTVRVTDSETPLDKTATIVVDALLGTGFHASGKEREVHGRYADLIRAINQDFPRAKIVAVDIPSAMLVRADYTVTFAAPKAEMLIHPNADYAGKLEVVDIGIPEDLMASGLAQSEARDFAHLFGPRKRDAHKGNFGHVLVVGGAPGKVGASSMSGLAALRMGAGLVTVACADASKLVPELMWLPLTEGEKTAEKTGAKTSGELTFDHSGMEKMTVLAMGPGLGIQRQLVAKLFEEFKTPMVIDADALNSIAGANAGANFPDGSFKGDGRFKGRGVETVLTPHPGEMATLLELPPGEKVTDRLGTARTFAQERNVCLVLKGFRTLIAVPDGRVWINPTGSPAMGKGGAGDILTGLVAGMIAQFPTDIATAVRAAVWLHGRAGELGAQALTEQCLLATDLLTYLPAAIRECAGA
jgi:ADP-dependent NAD(P)H-hydrate dehydratase / NAD(P)H-hydrate epimerase